MVTRYPEKEEENCYHSCFLSSKPDESSHRPRVKSFSGLNPMKIQARPTSRATTRLTVTQGFRSWGSEPGGLEEERRGAERGPAAGAGQEQSSPQRGVGGRVQVDPVAGHLLAQTQNQG